MVENPGDPDVGLICEWGDSYSQTIGLFWHIGILRLGFLWYQALGYCRHSRNLKCHNVC